MINIDTDINLFQDSIDDFDDMMDDFRFFGAFDIEVVTFIRLQKHWCCLIAW